MPPRLHRFTCRSILAPFACPLWHTRYRTFRSAPLRSPAIHPFNASTQPPLALRSIALHRALFLGGLVAHTRANETYLPPSLFSQTVVYISQSILSHPPPLRTPTPPPTSYRLHRSRYVQYRSDIDNHPIRRSNIHPSITHSHPPSSTLLLHAHRRTTLDILSGD